MSERISPARTVPERKDYLALRESVPPCHYDELPVSITSESEVISKARNRQGCCGVIAKRSFLEK